MRRIVVAMLGLAVLLSAAPLYSESNADVEKALQTKEQAGWQAWKDDDQKVFAEMIPDDAINIAGGAHGQGQAKYHEECLRSGMPGRQLHTVELFVYVAG